MKDTDYYNRISRSYSNTRYPVRTDTFVQFFFKKRLEIVLSLISECVGDRKGLSLLEIGCADGVVVRAIYERFPDIFSTLDAVDISAGMIEAARELHKDTPIHFEERSKLMPRTYDFVLEVGVLNYTPFAEDLSVIAHSLTANGNAIISIAGSNSLKNKLSPDKGYLHLSSYEEYEEHMREKFAIKKAVPVALLVPLLWCVPALARWIQSSIESSFATSNPDWFHEKVYLLSKSA